MFILCRILIVVFIILSFVFFLSSFLPEGFSIYFFFLSVVCFLSAVAFASLSICLADGVVTVEYFFAQCYDFFFSSLSGQHCDCCSCHCGR